MIILAVDTSSSNCSVAVSKDGSLLASCDINYEKQHSVILMPILEGILEKVNLKVKDVDLFVNNSGPGSFTGLRIGLSTLKAMSLSTNKQLIGFNSFEALSEPHRYAGRDVLIIIDALRNTFYSAILKFENNEWKYITEAKVRDINEINDLIKENPNVLITGDGVKKINEIKGTALVADQFFSISYASSLLSLAERKVSLMGLSELNKENVLPIYMRKSQAEREYDIKMGLKD